MTISLLENVSQQASRIANDISKQQNSIRNQLRLLDELKTSIEAVISGTTTGRDKKIIGIISEALHKGKQAQLQLSEAASLIQKWADSVQTSSRIGGTAFDWFGNFFNISDDKTAGEGSDRGGTDNFLSDIKRIVEEHSVSDDIKATNPNYDSSCITVEYNENCQRCIPTYEVRRRGYDVIAKPVPKNDDLCYNWTGMYKDAKPIKCEGNGYFDIVDKMKEWGEGSRGEIKVLWIGGRMGHVFAAEVIDGQVLFIDPQSNNLDCSDYFKSVQWGSVELLRTDKLNFTSRIEDCVTERR